MAVSANKLELLQIADAVARAHLEPAGLALEFQVLRDLADHGEGKDFGAFANRGIDSTVVGIGTHEVNVPGRTGLGS